MRYRIFLTSGMSWSQWAGMWICSLTVLCVLVCDVFVYCEDLHLGFGKDNAFTFLENSPPTNQPCPHPRRLRDFLQGWLSGHHDWGSIGNATRWTHHCTDYQQLIWKHTVGKSQRNVTSVIMHCLRQAIWGDTWNYPALGGSIGNATVCTARWWNWLLTVNGGTLGR